MTNHRDVFLDVLRVVAAVSVLFYHVGFRGYAADGLMEHVRFDSIAPVAQYGFMGVELFFIISGYVIFLSADGRSAREFVLSRAIRLYPTFWICAAITIAVSTISSDPKFRASGLDVALNIPIVATWFGGHHIDGSYWSLVLEIEFYIIVAIALKIWPMQRVHYALIAWVVLGCVASLMQNKLGLPIHYPGGYYTGFFAMGAGIYLLRRNDKTFGPWLLLAISYLSALGAAYFFGKKYDAYFGSHLSFALMAVLITVFGLLVYASPSITVRSSRWTRLAVFAGGVTYPFYLLHQNISYMIINHFFSQETRWLGLATSLITAIALASGVYAFYDRPVRRVLSKLAFGTRSRTAKPETVASA
ncbi:acyltransferase family protein [Caballeronia sp.]|uniref:acyltransferase family protein n=1 Tax=Caballeronia sp. TaxID=1931223 RepID=UPI003C4B30DB